MNVNHALLLNKSGPNRAAQTTYPRAATTPQPLAPQTVATVACAIKLATLFQHVSVITVFGCIEEWQLAWAGRISCSLRLSIGSIPLVTNRGKLPLEIQNGSWVIARLMLPRGIPEPGVGALLLEAAVQVKLKKNDPTTAWVPSVECVRSAHVQRLRKLLTRLEPGLQALFMAVMAEARVQRGFYTRIAATDHHTYPGGLFDQSIEAAEKVYKALPHLDVRERGAAALACLLFDIGKISDVHYGVDRYRDCLGMEPHPLTSRHMRLALDRVASFDPAIVTTMRAVLAKCDWTEWVGAPGIPRTLKQHVHRSLLASWQLGRQLEKPATDRTPTDRSTKGE